MSIVNTRWAVGVLMLVCGWGGTVYGEEAIRGEEPVVADQAVESESTAQAEAPVQVDVAPVVGSDEDSALRRDIRKLLDLSGSGKFGDRIVGQIIQSMQQSMPQIPAEFWTEFVGGLDLVEFRNHLVMIYETHFTHDDIKGLIAFYESPLGEKFLAAMPMIMTDSMQARQQWANEIVRLASQQLQQAGYLPPQGPGTGQPLP